MFAAISPAGRLRQRSGMSPEDVTLDLSVVDDFSVVCQSLPRTV